MAAEPETADGAPWSKIPIPTEPSAYQYKGALQHLNNTWVILYHCPSLSHDVVVKIKPIPDFLEDMERYWDKVNPMLRLRHPNLLTPLNAFTAGSDLWMVYERFSGGPLKEILATHFPQGIEEAGIVARILLDVLEGLQYMHDSTICHRNLRAANLHVSREKGRILLTEFGDLRSFDSVSADSQRLEAKHSIRGTLVPVWHAPEIVLHDDIEVRQFFKADVYAFGMTAMEIILGEVPTNNWDHTPAGMQIREVTFDSCQRECPFGKPVQTMIEACLKADPTSRPTVREIMKMSPKFWNAACSKEVIATRLGLLTRTTEQRINNNLFPPQSITQMAPGAGVVMTPHVSDEIQHDFGNIEVERLQHLNGDAPVKSTDSRDSGWDFTSTRLDSADIREMKVSDDGSVPPTPERNSNSDDSHQRQQSAGRFLIENPVDRNSGTRVQVQEVGGHRRSFSDSKPLQPRRTNSDFSDFGDPLSPSGSNPVMTDYYSRDSVSPNKNHRRSYSENNMGSPNEEQVGRFFVSRDRQAARNSESAALSGSESATTTPRITIQDEPSLSSSMDTIDESHSHPYDISDGLVAASIENGILPKTLRAPREPELSESDDREDSSSSNKVEVGRFNVEFPGHSPSTSDVPAPAQGAQAHSPPPLSQDLPPTAAAEAEVESAADIRRRLPDLEEEFYLRFPKWTEVDCAKFITAFGRVYVEVNEHMAEHAIDGEMFESLTDEDLVVMGVQKPLFRKKVITMRDRLLQYLAVRGRELNGRVRNGSTEASQH